MGSIQKINNKIKIALDGSFLCVQKTTITSHPTLFQKPFNNSDWTVMLVIIICYIFFCLEI